jgi:phosphoribosylamine--glycine ligase
VSAVEPLTLRAGRVLLIGAGAREHALADRLLSSPQVTELHWHPGHTAAIEWLSTRHPDRRLTAWPESFEHPAELAHAAANRGVELAVVGPEAPLAAGLADLLRSVGVPTCGPGQAAARLESSKEFAKEVLRAAGVATPAAQAFANADELTAHLATLNFERPWVLKADGLAQGKGVLVCVSPTEALAFASPWLAQGQRVLVEEHVRGRELSWLAFCDGERCALLEPACDCKSLWEGGLGHNTGGMGAWSPPQAVPSGMPERVRSQVFEPVLAELVRRGTPFRGVLYAGLMQTHADPTRPDSVQVLEFNVRWGDPEAQVLLARLQGDLVPWLLAAATGRLDLLPATVPMEPRPAVYVVAAAAGYPAQPRTGDEIRGLEPEATFLAGVTYEHGSWRTSGGRVAGVLGRGDSLQQARLAAYQRLSKLQFAGRQVRWDVGHTGKQPFVVLASGRGSNFAALVRAAQKPAFPGEVSALLCDRPDAPVLALAAQLAVPAFVCASEPELVAKLAALRPGLVALAGYRQLLSGAVLAPLRQAGVPVLNIHPSLLPELPGLHAYRRAFEAGLPSTGVTVHEVVEAVDAGRILAQRRFPIDDLSDPAAVEARGLQHEHMLYPQVVARVLATMDLPAELQP